jgi:hypothetical protein
VKKHKSILALLIAGLLLTILIGCTPSPQATDPISVTKAFFTAINQGKAEAAASCFAKDGELTAYGQKYSGQKLREFLTKSLISFGTRIETQKLSVDGVKIDGTIRVTNSWLKPQFPKGIPPFSVEGIVQDGKITSMWWELIRKGR